MSKVSSTIIRYTITLLVVVVGVAGGMYIGSELTGDKGYPGAEAQTVPEIDPHYVPHIAAGDLFPPIELTDSDAAPTLQALVKGRRSVIVFACGGCPSCTNLLEYWKRIIQRETADRIDLVLAQAVADKPLSNVQRQLVPEAAIVSCDPTQTKDLFNIIVQPTIFGLDNQGFVQVVQVGFDDHFTPEMSDFLHN